MIGQYHKEHHIFVLLDSLNLFFKNTLTWLYRFWEYEVKIILNFDVPNHSLQKNVLGK
jgi:hypothetical protein